MYEAVRRLEAQAGATMLGLQIFIDGLNNDDDKNQFWRALESSSMS